MVEDVPNTFLVVLLIPILIEIEISFATRTYRDVLYFITILGNPGRILRSSGYFVNGIQRRGIGGRRWRDGGASNGFCRPSRRRGWSWTPSFE